MFRLPLRTIYSRLGRTVLRSNVQVLLEVFSHNAVQHLLFTRNLRKITLWNEEGHASVYERSGEIPLNPLRTIAASYPTNKTYSFHVEHVMSVSVATDVDAWDDPSCNVEALLQIRAAVGASAAVGIRVPRHGGGI